MALFWGKKQRQDTGTSGSSAAIDISDVIKETEAKVMEAQNTITVLRSTIVGQPLPQIELHSLKQAAEGLVSCYDVAVRMRTETAVHKLVNDACERFLESCTDLAGTLHFRVDKANQRADFKTKTGKEQEEFASIERVDRELNQIPRIFTNRLVYPGYSRSHSLLEGFTKTLLYNNGISNRLKEVKAQMGIR